MNPTLLTAAGRSTAAAGHAAVVACYTASQCLTDGTILGVGAALLTTTHREGAGGGTSRLIHFSMGLYLGQWV